MPLWCAPPVCASFPPVPVLAPIVILTALAVAPLLAFGRRRPGWAGHVSSGWWGLVARPFSSFLRHMLITLTGRRALASGGFL